jgi:hypothetical protein
MAFKKQELLENLLSFREENGRFPTSKDFKQKSIRPSKNVYYRHFGSLKEAFNQAEALDGGSLAIQDESDEDRIRDEVRREKFRCPFCGGTTNKVKEYYSSLTIILSSRLINRLKSNHEGSYSEGVMDCICDVFGPENPVVRKKLVLEGYLEKFEKRFEERVADVGYQGDGKARCYKCGKVYEDYELTIDIISPYRTRDICENCIADRNDNAKEEGVEGVQADE